MLCALCLICSLHLPIQKQTEEERDALRTRLDTAESRVAELSEQNDAAAGELRQQTLALRTELQQAGAALESETAAHRTTALKNAEISQELGKIKQDLNDETAECAELTDSVAKLTEQLATSEAQSAELRRHADRLETAAQLQVETEANAGEVQKELAEKNKVS